MHEANAQSSMADAVKDEDLAEMERTTDLKNKLEDAAFTRSQSRLERWPRQVPGAQPAGCWRTCIRGGGHRLAGTSTRFPPMIVFLPVSLMTHLSFYFFPWLWYLCGGCSVTPLFSSCHVMHAILGFCSWVFLDFGRLEERKSENARCSRRHFLFL
jgi:hypothetical protein